MTTQLGAICYGDMIQMTSKHIMMDALCQRMGLNELVSIESSKCSFFRTYVLNFMGGQQTTDRYTRSNKK